MRLSLDVINSCAGDSKPIAQAVLAQMIVTLQDARSSDIPLAAIAALVPALALLMLLPAFITVLLTITCSVCSCARTTTLTAGSRN